MFLTCFYILKAETPVLTIEYKYSNAINNVHFQKMKLVTTFVAIFRQ